MPKKLHFFFENAGGQMQNMLNGMENLMTGGTEFDPALYQNLASCFQDLDPELMTTQDVLWQGLYDYANSQGQPSDPYPPCELAVSERKAYHH